MSGIFLDLPSLFPNFQLGLRISARKFFGLGLLLGTMEHSSLFLTLPAEECASSQNRIHQSLNIEQPPNTLLNYLVLFIFAAELQKAMQTYPRCSRNSTVGGTRLAGQN